MVKTKVKGKSGFWVKLILAPILMFFFAYALVPLYDVLCEVTGFNGKTGVVEAEKVYQVDDNRRVNVSFLPLHRPVFWLILNQKNMR